MGVAYTEESGDLGEEALSLSQGSLFDVENIGGLFPSLGFP